MLQRFETRAFEDEHAARGGLGHAEVQGGGAGRAELRRVGGARDAAVVDAEQCAIERELVSVERRARSRRDCERTPDPHCELTR